MEMWLAILITLCIGATLGAILGYLIGTDHGIWVEKQRRRHETLWYSSKNCPYKVKSESERSGK